MTPERYARIKEIFLGACEQPVDRRQEYVAQACGQDAELSKEVARLLSQHLTEHPETAKDETASVIAQPAPTPGTFDPSCLTAGQIINERYRIVSLLGEGAMGVVYRADDLRLGQPVTLKFLSAEYTRSPAWLRRFKSEVNLARQISHPNICRIYDLGEVNATPFITMEYVDGEDLASLLHRVGRLSDERGIEVATQICVGLAAAHKHGIVHRDLKPANIMIDKRGQVCIADFGLAAEIGGIDRKEIRSGTPRYMAPEQIAGRDVTQKSDIYSLGLVLYEIFVGQPAFDAETVQDYRQLHESTEPSAPSSIVPEINPTVESTILACLHKDPSDRPDSALAVAASLPGGNILAAALAAGEVPTREMLANAASGQAARPAAMYRLTALFILLVITALMLGRNNHPLTRHGEPLSPEALMQRCGVVAKVAAQGATPVDERGRFVPTGEINAFFNFQSTTEQHFQLAHPKANSLLFVYRASYDQLIYGKEIRPPFVMAKRNLSSIDATPEGMITVIMDVGGRLLFLESNHIPKPSDEAAPLEFSRDLILKAGALSPEKLKRAPPQLRLRDVYDEHMAFEESRANASTTGERVELATIDGVPQYFVALSEGAGKKPITIDSDESRRNFMAGIRNVVLIVLLVAAIPAAWRSRNRRGDLEGAVKLGFFIFLARLLADLLRVRHIGIFGDEIEKASIALVTALCEGMIVALFYLALESYVRRWWPQTVGGWSRVLTGRFSDRGLARDVLIGCCAGLLWASLIFVDRSLPEWAGWHTREQLRFAADALELHGARFAVAEALDLIRTGIYTALMLLLLLVVGVWIAQSKRWAAILGAWLIGSAMFAPSAAHMITAWTVIAIGVVATAILILIRVGLVSLVVAIFISGLWSTFPLSLNLNVWYIDYEMFVIILTVSLAGWALIQSARSSPATSLPSAS